MKKFFSYTIILLLIFNLNIYSFASPTASDLDTIKVKLKNEFLDFDVDPVIVNNRTMVPMRAIFEYLGSQVLWYGDTRTVVGYKDNMFIKLQIGSKTAYKNGKGFTLDSPPIIRDGRTLVPIRFISESLGMVVDWDSKNRTVLIDYDKKINTSKIIDGVLYKPIDVKDYGLKFMVPDYWKSEDNSNHSFKYEEDNNNVKMSINMVKFEKPKSLEEFTTENKNKILETYKNKVVFTGSSSLTVNNVKINVAFVRNSAVSPEINQAIYYVVNSSNGYIITFSYSSEANDSQFLNTFSSIINTLVITDRSVVYEEEHYLEYDKFFELGMKLDNEIHSNMDVKGKIDFKGSLQNKSTVDYLFVQVSKDNDKIEQRVPVKESKFDSSIYTPFGLGKHNVIVGTPLDSKNTSHYIMQFSTINTSREDIHHLVPSRFVESEDKGIVELANKITGSYLNELDEAKAIYKWIIENIEYDLKASPDKPRTAKEVLSAKKGDCDEISYLFAALSRAAGIHAKIGSGKIDEDLHAWNELRVNGKWIIADATWGAGYIVEGENEDIFIKKVDMSYFNPSRVTYEKDLSNIKYLPY